MLAVCAIAEHCGKVLICKRPMNVLYPGRWEFPTEPLEDDDTMEDALERGLFERLCVLPKSKDYLGAIDMAEAEGGRLFGFKTILNTNFVKKYGYTAFKWVKKEDLKRYSMLLSHVMFIKNLKKKSLVFVTNMFF